ncbi:MAG TPA: sodium:proton antiporter [Anaerolineales bacterium]|nr:sodium:proton antiporter [Anaerolineales bacterium]
MNVILSFVVATLFGVGAFLILKRDLIRLIMGMTLISNAAILFTVAAGLSRGSAPILPLLDETNFSDPLVQALALTAIVINFGMTILLLILVYQIWVTHHSIDQEALREAEERELVEFEKQQRGL